ncbi:potassium channel family protein [Microbacterium sp. SS28]|uniref:potassium channel family protein n=1 Tax=Microbacterium sp. SS28 TaxID=2919948 RepID=UPI001FAAAC1F|nr:potassium channel family protein [Microbacterium sp. SS28]
MTQERWRRITEWPLIIASILFLAAYAWQVIGDLSGPADVAAESVLWITWAAFVVDYVANLILVERGRRWRWFSTHLFDAAIVILPMLRPLRILRLVTLLAVLQRTAGHALRGRISVYAGGAAALLVFVAALAVLDAERDAPGSTITTFGDAVWWAFVTITTVGYGDVTPVTAVGRAIAVGLMVGGIALLGVVTATIASWIVERVGEHDEERDAATVGHIRSLEAKVDRLQETLDRLAA